MINKRVTQDVLIDLTKTTNGDATALPVNELIHQLQFSRICKLFDEQYKLASQVKDDDEHNNTISVFAKRGYGKTTFVKSFLNYVNNNDKYNCCCLAIIDPSMLELKQHPFIHVLSMIQEKVDCYIDSHDSLQNPLADSYFKYTEWQRAYKNLRCSLSVLDCVGDANFYKDWDNAEHIAKIGMKQATDANNIRKYFVKYLNESLKILNKECFLLVFDDIDTNFRKGFEILETIRKYLSVTKIITVMTGDINLYSKLIRQNLWTGFNIGYLSLEKSNAQNSFGEISNLIDQLEEQYLLKILKPENRLTLSSVEEEVSTLEISPTVKYRIGENEITEDLIFIYNRLCSLLDFNSQSRRTDEIVSFVMSLPFRTQIRILTAICNERITPSELVHSLVGIFRTDISLKVSMMDGDFLINKNFGKILEFLCTQDVLNTNSNFMPDNADMTLNKALFAIGAVVNKAINDNLYLLFDYWIRISYVKMSFKKIQYNEMIEFSGINSDKSLNKAYCLSHAFYNSKNVKFVEDKKTSVSLPGVCRISDYGEFAGAFNNNPLIGLALFETKADSDKSTCFLSFYKLLATIGDILNVDTLDKKTNPKIGYSLNVCSQFRSYMEPDTNAPETRRDAVESGKNNYTLASYDFQNKTNEISKWLGKYNNLQHISAGILDRVFVRTYYAISELEKENFNNAGDKFNNMVIAFLNAVLVEEALDKGFVNINISGRDNILLVFFHNLQLLSAKSSLEMFGCLSQCPLLTDFIDPYYKELMNLLIMRTANDININYAVLRRWLKIKCNNLEQEITTYNEKSDKLDKQYKQSVDIKNNVNDFNKNKDSMDEDSLNKRKNELHAMLTEESNLPLPDALISYSNVSSDYTNLLSHLEDNMKNTMEEIISVNKQRKRCNIELERYKNEYKTVDESSFNGGINIDDTKKSLYNSMCEIKLL